MFNVFIGFGLIACIYNAVFAWLNGPNYPALFGWSIAALYAVGSFRAG